MANGSYDVTLLDTTKELIQMLGTESYLKINRKKIRGLIPQTSTTDLVPNIDKNANILVNETPLQLLHAQYFLCLLRFPLSRILLYVLSAYKIMNGV